MARKKKKNHFLRNFLLVMGGFIILAAAGILYFCLYKNHNMPNGLEYDENWPQKDLTYGDYSGGYDGIDISYYQGRIDWETVKKNKHIKFIYIKATEGKDLVDPCYRRNIENARKCGIPVGSYHFLNRHSTGNLQFLNFCRTAKKHEQDLRPVIDCEDNGTMGLSREKIQKLLNAFVKACKEEYGKNPIIYCSESYYKDYLAPEFDDYILFIANYSRRPVLPGKPKFKVWQFSEKGRIPGFLNWVDLDKLGDDVDVDDLRL